VDLVARVIVTAARDSHMCADGGDTRVLHIVGDGDPTLEELVGEMVEVGWNVGTKVDSEGWRRVLGMLQEGEPGFKVRGLLDGMGRGAEWERKGSGLVKEKTEKWMKRCGIEWVKVDRKLMRKYFDFFVRVGFFPKR